MLKIEWTNRDALGCNNITCANCQYNDGVVYTSMPPQYKCTITNEFHHNNDKCDVEFAPVKHGYWIDRSVAFYRKCSECGCCMEWNKEPFLHGDGEYNYCPNCGAKMEKNL